MLLEEIVNELPLSVATSNVPLDREVSGGYAGDLLSDVMGNSRSGQVWVTFQTHLNVIAVAVLKELSAIVIVNGRKLDADTLARAEEKGIPMLLTELTAFELIGRLYRLGVSG